MIRSDLSGIIQGLRDPVLVVELQGIVLPPNADAAKLFQRPSPELVGIGGCGDRFGIRTTAAYRRIPRGSVAASSQPNSRPPGTAVNHLDKDSSARL